MLSRNYEFYLVINELLAIWTSVGANCIVRKRNIPNDRMIKCLKNYTKSQKLL